MIIKGIITLIVGSFSGVGVMAVMEISNHSEWVVNFSGFVVVLLTIQNAGWFKKS